MSKEEVLKALLKIPLPAFIKKINMELWHVPSRHWAARFEPTAKDIWILHVDMGVLPNPYYDPDKNPSSQANFRLSGNVPLHKPSNVEELRLQVMAAMIHLCVHEVTEVVSDQGKIGCDPHAHSKFFFMTDEDVIQWGWLAHTLFDTVKDYAGLCPPKYRQKAETSA